MISGDINWNSDKLLNDVMSTLSCCRGLVIVDEEELTVRLAHHSVKQFLLNDYRDSVDCAIKIGDAKRTMVEIVLTYFNYGIFNTQLFIKVILRIAAGSIPKLIVKATLGSPSGVRNRALSLLRSRKALNHDIGKVIADTSQHLNAPLKNEFPFHAYAKTFWFQHIQEQPSITYDLLLRAIRMTLIDVNIEGQDGQTPLWWAMENGHEAVVKLLLETGKVNTESKNQFGETPLSWAAKNGHEAVVKLLERT